MYCQVGVLNQIVQAKRKAKEQIHASEGGEGVELLPDESLGNRPSPLPVSSKTQNHGEHSQNRCFSKWASLKHRTIGLI